MNCHDCRDWLERRLDGDSPVEIPGLEEHLAGCAGCRQQHQAAQRLLESLQNLRGPLLSDELSSHIVSRVLDDIRFRRRRLRFRIAAGFALAASLLVAVLGGYLRLPVADRGREDIAKDKGNVPDANDSPSAQKQAASAVVAAAPSLTSSVEEAGAAVVSFTGRLADKGKQQAQVWWPASALAISEALPDVKKLEAPLDPAAQSLRQTGQGMTEGLQTVAQSARRAFAYFARELPPLNTKSGS